MSIQINDFSILLGSFLALLIAIAVWLKAPNRQLSNLFLVLFLLNISFSILLKFLYFNQLFQKFPHLLKLNHPLGLLRPVCFYLYFYYLFRPQRYFNKKHLLHFVPTVGTVLYTLPFYIHSASQKIEIVNQARPDPAPTSLLFMGFTVTLAFVYLFLSGLEWYQFQRKMDPQKTLNSSSFNQWLWLMLLGYLLYLISAGGNWLFSEAGVEYASYQIISLFLTIGCIRLLSHSSLPAYRTLPNKYQKSSLTTAQKKSLHQKLSQLMMEERLYLQENLRLKEVAQKMAIGENELSQLVNEQEKVSFNDFVNQYRIKAAQKLLLSDQYQKTTIEAIGYDVGFGTRASFYNAFKKMTGLTPNEYRTKNL